MKRTGEKREETLGRKPAKRRRRKDWREEEKHDLGQNLQTDVMRKWMTEPAENTRREKEKRKHGKLEPWFYTCFNFYEALC
jgi:hypothetical protein